MKGTVYLIHLERKIAHAQHYIGWAKWFENRIRHHRKGTGAKILAEAVRREINFEVVRTWKNEDGNFEQLLKKQKNAKRFCPVCQNERSK